MGRIRTGIHERFRERATVAIGLPDWMHAGATATAFILAANILAFHDGRLPLVAQVLLLGLAMVPWLPGARIRSTSVGYVALGLVPVAVLALTGSHPVSFGLFGLATARVALYGPPLLSGSVAAAGIALVLVRSAWIDAIDWFVWKSYIELGLALGWALRGQRMLLLRSEDGAQEKARLAALEERRRIARDIHDTLAHSLTVMMVHLNSARLQLEDDPDNVAASLEELAALGRASLEEVRRSVGLLSSAPAVSEPADPTSAAFAVEELVASFRRAGVDVDLRLDVGMAHMGLLADAPTRLWGTAYRLVQESLANATKHAPGEPVAIVVDIDDNGLRIQVSNPLPDSVVTLDVPSGGHGLPGMRDRVELLGGTVTAGSEGVAWVVRAHLPLSATAAEPRRPVVLGRVS